MSGKAKASARSTGAEAFIAPGPEAACGGAALVPATPPFRPRAAQLEFERGVDRHRVVGFVCRRQYGKTTQAGRLALKKMMRFPGHTVVFGSVKLDLGREIVRTESAALQKAIGHFTAMAERAGTLLKVVDSRRGHAPAALDADAFAELYEATRLEFRLYHDRTTYSRTKVVALTPEAVGETGDLILDEVGRVRHFRDVWEAVRPIIASNPAFRCVITTTPPPEDTHYSFELLAPPSGTEFRTNPAGNWYRSEPGVHVLRVDAWDAAADDVPLYDDDTGERISPEESRARDPDKDGWDRNYGVRFVPGGSAALGLLQLDAARRRGVGHCLCAVVQHEGEFAEALSFLAGHLGAGAVGVGVDLATTERESSNPTAVTVLERREHAMMAVLTVVWKTADPALARDRLRRVIEAVNARPAGGPVRRVCVDATNERYFAAGLQNDLGHLAPVELVVGSESAAPSGGEPVSMKALLGNRLVAAFDDGVIAVAPERYLHADMRLVRRDRGSFTAQVGPAGEHGDTFDSHKLALHALVSDGDSLTREQLAGIRTGANRWRPAGLHFHPSPAHSSL